MVKRKANISLNEWLEQRVEVDGESVALVAAAREEVVQTNCPTTEVSAQGVIVAQGAMASAEVASHVDEVDTWFWNLLEMAGYERW